MSERSLTPSIAIIAEDEELGRLLLSEAASACGLTPLAFDNGVEALQAALTHNAAIVLLDVDMPGADGYSVCRALRERGPSVTVPIVMVTGHEDTAAIDQAFEAGATDYIAKPVNWSLLPHRLAYILRNAASVRALADREAKVRTLVDAIPDALWVVSPEGVRRWSPSDQVVPALAGNGLKASAIFEETVTAETLGEALVAVRLTSLDGQPRSLQYREARAGDDAPLSAELRFSRCEDGDVLIVRQDTSERTAAAAHIERLAYFDPLTGLPNRERCIALATEQLTCCQQTDSLAVVYLDLNGFKRINDTFGHAVSNVIIKAVAGRLAGVLTPFQTADTHALLSCFGADEFVVVVRDAAARTTAMRLGEACRAALRQSVTVGQMEFSATASIGVACYASDGADIETLLKHADTAMYHAKVNGLSEVTAYSPAMSARLRDALDLETRLRRALRDDLLSLRFQPKWCLQDDRIVGAEALMRWIDGEHGEIAPSRFIQVAERSGLIVEMGVWMIGAVCGQLRSWLDCGVSIPIAINLSGKELVYGDSARVVEAALRKHQVPASLLEIEITESVLISDASAGQSTIKRLRELGCRIALDDFGTGFSSLAYLTKFPPDRIKIDRSFIRNVDRSANDAAIVNAIMSLAQSLDLVVTAEGIERPGQLEWLRARGCQEGQGYLLGRPLSAAELATRVLRPEPSSQAPEIGIEVRRR